MQYSERALRWYTCSPVKNIKLNDTAIYSFCSDTVTYLSTLINNKAISLSVNILNITTISPSSILKRYSNDAIKSPLLNVVTGGIVL